MRIQRQYPKEQLRIISGSADWTLFAAEEEDEANPCQIYVMSLK